MKAVVVALIAGGYAVAGAFAVAAAPAQVVKPVIENVRPMNPGSSVQTGPKLSTSDAATSALMSEILRGRTPGAAADISATTRLAKLEGLPVVCRTKLRNGHVPVCTTCA